MGWDGESGERLKGDGREKCNSSGGRKKKKRREKGRKEEKAKF